MSDAGFNVALRFLDGVEHTVVVRAGETILDAAIARELPVLYQCRSGSCGTCIGRLGAGAAQMRKDIASSLLESEKKAGFRLTCCTRPSSDCVIEFDYDSRAGQGRPVQAHAFIDAIDWLAADVARLRLELAEGDWLDFKPGQFVQIKVPGTARARRYSMASTPDGLPKLDFLIRVLADGVMSEYLRERAQVEDVLEIEGPYGSFFMRERLKARHVLIAGGTGLAPILSMLDAIRARSSKKPPILLSFGCSDETTLFYSEELELRALWMPTLELRISVDRGEPRDGLRTGNPVEVVDANDVDAETIAYLCGPPAMIDAAHERLEALGMKAENIHAEQFVAMEE
jgi:benzoate/toluate 1,2-dioxygenase reductase subunit